MTSEYTVTGVVVVIQVLFRRPIIDCLLISVALISPCVRGFGDWLERQSMRTSASLFTWKLAISPGKCLSIPTSSNVLPVGSIGVIEVASGSNCGSMCCSDKSKRKTRLSEGENEK